MPPRRRRNPLLIAGVVGCGVAVGAVALYLIRRRNQYLTDSAETAPEGEETKEQNPAKAQKPAVATDCATTAPAAKPSVAADPTPAKPAAAEPTAAKPSAAKLPATEPAPEPATAETQATEKPPELARLSSAQGVLDGAVFSCFLSHGMPHWGTDESGRDNHARVAAIHAQLTAAGLNCWFDEEQMQGDINSKMTAGIDDSAVVVCFITSRYVTKVSGKLEFDYSVLRKGVGRMVAVVMEPGMKNPRSWAGVVGAKLGTKLYVDLAADEAEGAFAAGVRHLAKEIQDRADGSFGRGLGRSGSSLHPQPASLHPQPASLHPQPAAVPDIALAPIPPEVPEMPESVVERPELIAALKKSVLRQDAEGKSASADAPQSVSRRDSLTKSNATTAVGMGGVGKTMIAASFVNDEEVRAKFDKVCWVSLGQEPDIEQLQQTLHIQLTGKSLPEAAKEDERVGLQALKEAVKAQRVLLVLDDVWVKAHAAQLNFLDRSSASASVVATTRLRSLLDGATEVQCGVLPREAALELLLRAGGCPELLDAPPSEAVEAVEICGRLPLALGLAGGIIAEMADSWQEELLPLLKDEFEVASVEERIVTASLRVVPVEIRAGVEGLFTLFAVFAEDRTVPVVVLDALASLIPGDIVPKQPAQARRQVRKWLAHLIKANVLLGSVETGVHVHDLVRDCMVRAAEAREGGLRATQREVVALLLAAFDGPATSYVASGLAWHVRQAHQPEVPVQDDALLMQALLHKSAEVCASAAHGIGPEVLKEAISTCEASGKWWEAAQLNYALSTTRGLRGGEDVLRAWAAIGRVTAETDESRALEARILSMVLLSTEGGFDFTSPEYSKAMARAKELRQKAPTSGGDDGAASFEAALGSGIAVHMKGVLVHGFCSFVGFAPSVLEASHADWVESCAALERAALAAPDVIRQDAAAQFANHLQVMCNRIHTLPGYAKLLFLGEGGCKLRANVDRYDFGQMHAAHKSGATGIDIFLYATNEAGLLLFFGDVAGARAGWEKQVDAWRRIELQVQAGERTWDSYVYEGFMAGLGAGAGAMMAAGERRLLREYLRHHACGSSMLRDPAASSSLTEALSQRFPTVHTAPFWWEAGPDGDGHRYVAELSIALQVRALVGVLDMDAERDGDQRIDADSDDDAAALQAWLPPASELLHNAQREWHFYALMRGAAHPALLCAALYGRRLGAWDVASEIAEGFLALHDSADDSGRMEPLARIEAWRLLARCHEARGDAAAACEGLKAAQDEAAAVGYVFMEQLVHGELRELRGRDCTP